MKRFILIISVLFVFLPAFIFAAPSTDLTVGYDTDNFDEGTCQLRLRVVAHFFYDTLNFCGIGNACDVTTGEITVTGQGSPYVLARTRKTCSGVTEYYAPRSLTSLSSNLLLISFPYNRY